MHYNQEDYLKDRLDHQIDWYSRKSSFHHKMYTRLQIVTIIAAASIPFLSGYASDDTPIIKVLIGLIGIVIASITAILSLNKYQENWMSYRQTSEALKHEKYLYLTMTDPYQGEDAFQVLVQRVEGLISNEHDQWTQYMKKHQQEERRVEG